MPQARESPPPRGCRRTASLVIIAALWLPAAARAEPAEPDDDVARREGRGWRVRSGLRAEQWISPLRDGVRFDVRLTLPDMARGPHLSLETFTWERLDVGEERPAGSDAGTIYQVLGARYRVDRDRIGLFAGAHLLSWSGDMRLLTPWAGIRLGRADGIALSADIRLLGLTPLSSGGSDSSRDFDVAFAVEGPGTGPWRLAARGRARAAHQPTRIYRDEMASIGVELAASRRRLFLGLGVQRQRVPVAPSSADAMANAPAATTAALADPAAATTILLHLDLETWLPAALTAP